jgi:hypothetical protein
MLTSRLLESRSTTIKLLTAAREVLAKRRSEMSEEHNVIERNCCPVLETLYCVGWVRNLVPRCFVRFGEGSTRVDPLTMYDS